MSAKRIAEIKARADAASEGPWIHSAGGGFVEGQCYEWINTDRYSAVTELTPEDAAFANHARADVPWLLAQLEEARSLARMFLDTEISGADWQEYNERLKAWE